MLALQLFSCFFFNCALPTKGAPFPSNENFRVEVLKRYHLLDTVSNQNSVVRIVSARGVVLGSSMTLSLSGYHFNAQAEELKFDRLTELASHMFKVSDCRKLFLKALSCGSFVTLENMAGFSEQLVVFRCPLHSSHWLTQTASFSRCLQLPFLTIRSLPRIDCTIIRPLCSQSLAWQLARQTVQNPFVLIYSFPREFPPREASSAFPLSQIRLSFSLVCCQERPSAGRGGHTFRHQVLAEQAGQSSAASRTYLTTQRTP